MLHGLFSSCGKQAFLSCRGPQASLTAAASPVSPGSMVCGLSSCGPAACDIFPGQGADLCPLQWQAESLPLGHQGRSGRGSISQASFMFPSVLFPVPGFHPGCCIVELCFLRLILAVLAEHRLKHTRSKFNMSF